jgi:hypothetical protein
VLPYPKLFADETPLPVLDPGRGKTKTCRLWVAAMDDRPWDGPAPPAVVYVLAEDRKGERATELFEGFNGILQVDGYTGYNGLLDPARPGGAVKFVLLRPFASQVLRRLCRDRIADCGRGRPAHR